jgi:DNA-binding NarL/FixJ family response regulator
MSPEESTDGTIRVLVVDDHDVVRRMICSLLRAESDIVVISDTCTGADAIAEAKKHRPDVVVLDVSLPDMNGLAVAKLLRETVPSCRILVLSEHGESIAKEVFRAGAIGYLLKSDAPRELITAMRKVNGNYEYMSARFAQAPRQSEAPNS